MKRLTLLTLSVIFTWTLYGQNVQTITYETWTSGSWQNSMEQSNTYNGNGYLINNLTLLWDSPSGSYKNNSQINYTNNSNGICQQYIEQTWDSPTSSWKNSQRATYTYNSSNQPLTITYQTWTSGNWQNSTKQSNTYSNNGYLTNTLTLLWDSPAGSYKNYSQANYTNNSSNKPLTITYQTWINGNWQNSMKQSNTYNGVGYLINTLTQLWNSPLASYKDYSKVNYTNNGNGTVQQYIMQTWDTPASSWKNWQRATYTYMISTGIFEADKLGFKIFPNPSQDIINISLMTDAETKITITDLQGKMISSKTCYGSETTIDVTELPLNLYFIILEQDNQIWATRFIKN